MTQAGVMGKVLPLSLIKTHCRIEAEQVTQDTLLLQLEAAAVRAAEGIIHGPLLERECITVLSAWPVSPCLLLPVAHPKRVNEIRVMRNGRQQNWADYRLLRDDCMPAGRVKPIGAWPLADNVPDAITLRYSAGISATPEDMPEDIRQWLLFRIATFLEFSEQFVQGAGLDVLPGNIVDSLLDPYRLDEVVL